MINCHYGKEKGERMEFINNVAQEAMKGTNYADIATKLGITEDEVNAAMEELKGFNPSAYDTIMQMRESGNTLD